MPTSTSAVKKTKAAKVVIAKSKTPTKPSRTAAQDVLVVGERTIARMGKTYRGWGARHLPAEIAVEGAERNPFAPIITIITGSADEIIKRTREGFPASVFGDISTYLQMPQTQLFDALGVSRSTVSNRKKGDQPLSVMESDKVVRVAKVLARATNVLGDDEQARTWLCREIRSIGGVPPITMLDTEAGYELVMDTLGRIEHGIAA